MNRNTCEQTEIVISKPMFKKLEESTQRIALLLTEETIQLHCNQQREIIKVIGNYQQEIPINCRAVTAANQETNYQQQTTMYQPVLLPQIKYDFKPLTKSDTQLRLEH